MSDTKLFFAKGDSPEMIAAFEKAQQTFKYFWREMSWEYRRIIPALDMACVKVAFSEEVAGQDEPIVEHMWINQVGFDGINVYGELINEPNELTNISNGDPVKVPLTQISDWLFSSSGKTYGGFTIHAMRAQMSDEERQEHDEAWGIDFGDFNDIEVVMNQKEQPENLEVHPMDRNTKEGMLGFLKENPGEVKTTDELGLTLLHIETIAGNINAIEALLEMGADKNATTPEGRTALDLAKLLQWSHLTPVLEK